MQLPHVFIFIYLFIYLFIYYIPHIFIYMLSVNGWIFNVITMHFNEIDLLYQQALKYQHHAENYQESLAQDITPFGQQLKKKPAITVISPDLNNQ